MCIEPQTTTYTLINLLNLMMSKSYFSYTLRFFFIYTVHIKEKYSTSLSFVNYSLNFGHMFNTKEEEFVLYIYIKALYSSKMF